MTTEIISQQPSAFSLAEQAFLDAENQDEQNLAEEYLNLCSAIKAEYRTYLRTHPNDIAAGCRFFAARTAQTNAQSMLSAIYFPIFSQAVME